jgi:hypothetical protein
LSFGGVSVRVGSSLLVGALLATILAAPASAVSPGLTSLDVGLRKGTDPAVVARESGVEVRATEPVEGLNAVTFEVNPGDVEDALVALRDHPAVRYAEPGVVLHADGDPHDAANRADFEAMTIPEARTWSTGSPEVTVAVLDTGVTPNPDLPGGRLVPGRDLVDGDADTSDDDGHGTMVANLIAAEAGNGVGTTGVCSGCRIMPVRVLAHRDGLPAQGTSADVGAGIVWAADHGARVINLSMSTTTPSALLEEAVKRATDRGVLVVAAAGNGPGDGLRYPAAYEWVLSVGALGAGPADPDDDWVWLRAYTGFVALDARGEPRRLGGTSSAAAVVSGVAGLMFSYSEDTFMEQVHSYLSVTANHREHPGLRAGEALYNLDYNDDVDPTVSFALVPSGQQVVTVRPTATDDHAVYRLELLVDGNVVDTDEGRPRWRGSLQWRPPAGFAGTVSVTVAVTDYKGNYSVAPAVRVPVDNAAPTGSIVSPAAGARVRTSLDVVVETPEASPAAVTVNRVPMLRVPGTRRWKARTSPVNGVLQVAITDAAGNTVTLRRSVVVDEAGPVVGAVSPAQSARVRGTVTSTLSRVTDGAGVARAELWANGKLVGADTTAPYSLPVRTGTFNGAMDLRWKVTDKIGNVRVVTRRVTVDNRAPAVSITAAPKHRAKVKGRVTVRVAASDPAGVARVELLVNGTVVARDTTAGYVLSVDTAKQRTTMAVRVRAYDRLGNVTLTAVRTWTR